MKAVSEKPAAAQPAKWGNRQNVKNWRRQQEEDAWAQARSRRDEKKRKQRSEKRARRQGPRDVTEVQVRGASAASVRVTRKSGSGRDAEVTERYGILGHISCGRKNRYSTEAMARDTARFLMLDGSQRLYVYHCMCCDGWHISHRLMTDEERSAQAAAMMEHEAGRGEAEGA